MSFNRRDFLKQTTIAGLGLTMTSPALSSLQTIGFAKEKRIGIIGLDTSHAIAFTKEFNVTRPDYTSGFRVVAAYPQGSLDIESSVSRVPGYIEEVKKMGVEIVKSIDDLLKKVDLVLLETNDGRRHLEQAIPVLKAGKTMFIDKPMAASLSDVIAIFKLADHYKVPVFSSSSLRYVKNAQEVANGKMGKVLGADTYGPCSLEKTHPDLFWYGIHGIEMLYTVMGTGCKEVVRTQTKGTDFVVGTWEDGRIGSFRGTRTGKYAFGGTAFCEEGDALLGPYGGYGPLLEVIVDFFKTGKPPISPEETIEIFALMEAADESKLIEGGKINVREVWNRALRKADQQITGLI